MTKKEKHNLSCLLVAHHVRNQLEDLHAGKFPVSLSGDYSDVKVVTPEREIPWNELSRISEEEMHFLMLEIEKTIKNVLSNKEYFIENYGEKDFYHMLKNVLFKNGPTWNRKDYKDYKDFTKGL